MDSFVRRRVVGSRVQSLSMVVEWMKGGVVHHIYMIDSLYTLLPLH